ncbi:MAG: TIGR02281 family clan AA aspartic protease [Alphaproteobacteria bacterium]|nr:MAG: TIGR02281 family clan AA aspartic protease [Alphaproteobacteria bacterium]
MIGWAFRQLVIWGGLGLLVYAFVGNRELLMPRDDGQAVAAVSAPAAQPNPNPALSNSLTYHADQRGHVVLEGAVNGATVRFLVDTGATFVALTVADAAAAGIGRGSLNFNATMNTANGKAHAALVKLREVRIGQLSINDVNGVVQENLPYSLLGMSFLKRVDSWEMRDGILTLNWQ